MPAKHCRHKVNIQHMIETNRTTIRKISLADAPFIFELVNSTAWIRFIGNRNINNLEAAKQYLRNGFLKYETHPGFSYYLAQTKDETPMGICGFLKKPYLEYVDFGFAFIEKYHRQGYGYEVGHAVLAYGIEMYNFKTLDAVTHPDNLPSIGLLEKLGFQQTDFIDIPEMQRSKHFRWRAETMSGEHHQPK
ncbi:MAG: GNAT family N-acetyltransferase [Chloroflexi bacterium]|nr:GNAT family N-acetyltransferase [Chloroflexota bacterium]